jgi:hypothetical protein
MNRKLCVLRRAFASYVAWNLTFLLSEHILAALVRNVLNQKMFEGLRQLLYEQCTILCR